VREGDEARGRDLQDREDALDVHVGAGLARRGGRNQKLSQSS
jgi:hypothetical protein